MNQSRKDNMNKTPIDENDVLLFLDDLRTSGITNMFGASPYLEKQFGMKQDEAIRALSNWIRTFSERHPNG
jgi:hypothetical protein